MLSLLTVLLSALLACQDSSTTKDEDTGEITEITQETEDQLPGEYVYTPEDESVVFDPVAAAASLEAFFDVVYTLNSAPVIDAYFDTLNLASSDCPSVYPGQGEDLFWISSTCETETGTRFSGYASYYEYNNESVFRSDDVRYSGAQLRGVGQVVEPDGTTLWMEGEVYNLVGQQDDLTVHYSSMEGWFSWDRPEVLDIWLGDDRVNPNLELRASSSGAYRKLEIEGGVSGLSGGYESIYLSDISLGAISSNPECQLEPEGALWLRADNGEWFELIFEGGPASGSNCDGCGRVFQGIDELDPLCVDFSRLLAWSVSPW